MSPFIEHPPLRFGAIPRSFIQDNGRPFRNSVGQWILVAGPRLIRSLMTRTVLGLAEEEAVRVLDGGSGFDSLLAAQLASGEKRHLDRVRLSRPANTLELLHLLEREATTPVPFIGLDLLSPFYDSSIAFTRRQQVLKACFANLRRLQLSTSGIISVSPPKGHYPMAKKLFAMVEAEARKTFDKEILLPGWEMKRMM